MDEVFYSYFNDRLSARRQVRPTYSDAPGSEEADVAVSSALEETAAFASARGRTLRPDASLFLYTTFLEMVAVPLTTVRGYTPADIHGLVRADMQRVTERAATDTDDPEISAHRILTAFSEVWPELGLADMASWGP